MSPAQPHLMPIAATAASQPRCAILQPADDQLTFRPVDEIPGAYGGLLPARS
jgi:hypothetical protein